MRGLIIEKEWLDLIFSGRKTCELRQTNTARQGEIALIEKGSGPLVGKCELVDSLGPLPLPAPVRRTRVRRSR